MSLLKAQARRKVGGRADLIWHHLTRLEVPLPHATDTVVIQQCFAPHVQMTDNLKLHPVSRWCLSVAVNLSCVYAGWSHSARQSSQSVLMS